MKKYILLVLIPISFLLLGIAAYCWTISDDLKAEIEEKEWLIKVHPKDPLAFFDLAITYAYSNKIEEGLNMLKKVNELDKGFAPKALDIYSKRLKYSPDDWKVRFRFAFALYFSNKKDEAIREFEQIIKQYPDNVFSYAYIALIYGEKEKADQTVEWCIKAIDVDSNVAVIHLLLAAAYYKKGQALLGFQETFESLRLRALGY